MPNARLGSDHNLSDLKVGDSYSIEIKRSPAFTYVDCDGAAASTSPAGFVELSIHTIELQFNQQKFVVAKGPTDQLQLQPSDVGGDIAVVERAVVRFSASSAFDTAGILITHLLSNNMVTTEELRARLALAGYQ